MWNWETDSTEAICCHVDSADNVYVSSLEDLQHKLEVDEMQYQYEQFYKHMENWGDHWRYGSNTPTPVEVSKHLWDHSMRLAKPTDWFYWRQVEKSLAEMLWDTRLAMPEFPVVRLRYAEAGMRVHVACARRILVKTNPKHKRPKKMNEVFWVTGILKKPVKESEGYWYYTNIENKEEYKVKLGKDGHSEAILIPSEFVIELFMKDVISTKYENVIHRYVEARCPLTKDVLCSIRVFSTTTLGEVRNIIDKTIGDKNGVRLVNWKGRVMSNLEDHRRFLNVVYMSLNEGIRDAYRLELFDIEGNLFWHSR